MMSIELALTILADSHTRDDDVAGFVVDSGPSYYMRWSQAEYIEAWKTVRQHLNRQVMTIHERKEAEAYRRAIDAASPYP